MLVVSDQVSIRGDLPRVYDCFWNPTLWPRITPHVREIEMLEQSESHQRFRMRIASGPREYLIETERHGVPGRSIRYRQTQPPPFLRRHTGEWRFRRRGEQVEVRLTHRADLDGAKAMELLGVASTGEAERVVGEALRRNGALTLAAVKELVESI